MRRRRLIAQLDAQVKAMLAIKRKQADTQTAATQTEGGTLIDVLLRVTDEHGRGLSDEQLRDHVMTYAAAGYTRKRNG